MLRQAWKQIRDAEYRLDETEQEEYGFNDRYSGRRVDSAEKNVHDAYRNLSQVKESICLIGRICVQYRLPAGDPCWMAKMIGSYV
jgi:hypothetical protein